jgi:hypothetical protein
MPCSSISSFVFPSRVSVVTLLFLISNGFWLSNSMAGYIFMGGYADTICFLPQAILDHDKLRGHSFGYPGKGERSSEIARFFQGAIPWSETA